jgi:NhaA family Na+:H+ antiporter
MTSAIHRLLTPLHKLLKHKSTSGILLFSAVVAAMVWVNSPWGESYHRLWALPLGLRLGGHTLTVPLHGWINDGLMALFFFSVGLEIKREVLAGELSSLRKATLPIAAAIAGMVVPALIYGAFNRGTPAVAGWGIPMATDIAFSLGLLSLLGSRVPVSLKIFLTALAVVDDLGSVLVIAFFYTSAISFASLGWGLAFLLVLLAGNLAGIRHSAFYAIIGIGGLWLAFLLSGVHATIAGVLCALTIPGRVKINEELFVEKMRVLTEEFDRACRNNVAFLTEPQLELIEKIKKTSTDAETPLQKIEYGLNPLVSFGVLPLFALSNGGIALEGNLLTALLQPVSLGVALGLLLGKFAGIVGISRLLVGFRLASLPGGTTWGQLYGVGMLAGIGFTMSLFVSELAFTDPLLIREAKMGIFAASLLAAVLGLVLLRVTSPPPAKGIPEVQMQSGVPGALPPA